MQPLQLSRYPSQSCSWTALLAVVQMGQYYLLINLDKRECMSVFAAAGLPLTSSFSGRLSLNMKFLSGSKLSEQLYNLGVKPFLALALIATSPQSAMPNPAWGRWSGDRLVLIGDYSEDVPASVTQAEREELAAAQKNLYIHASDVYKEVVLDSASWINNAKELPSVVPEDGHHVFANLDLKEFIDPLSFGSDANFDLYAFKQDGIMKALYSCLFFSSGGGGGDIDALTAGRWAGNRLTMVDITVAVREGCTNVSSDVKALLTSCGDIDV